MKSRTYVIGRQGDIRLDSDTVGRRHAELIVADDRCFLTDLNSMNGTFLIQDGQRIPFTQGYVSPDQEFAFGECVRSVQELLNMATPGPGGSGARKAPAAVPKPAAGASGGPEKEWADGPRKRCGACGAVMLSEDPACPECGSNS